MTPLQVNQMNNHPKKGSVIVVEPLRSLEDVARVKAVLSKDPRNLALFTLGVNTNLRAGDLLSLKVSDINWDKEELILREEKTDKRRHIALSPGVMKMLLSYVQDDGLLFPSSKGGGQMTVQSLNNMVKLWCLRAGIKGNFGSHTLRKTWAFIQYKIFGTDLALISRELNHSSLRTTYAYLGIMPEDVRQAYMNEI